MIYKRPKTRCFECPLGGKKCVYGTGDFSSHLAIYGEAPGADEEREGVPFVGKAGRLLSWGLVEAGIMRRNAFVSNVILCRPPGNDIKSLEAKGAIDACASGFQEELEMLKSKGITTILALGNAAAHAFGVGENITKARGSIYQYLGFNVIPTFHPSYLNRMGYSRRTGRVDFKLTWINDLRKARDVASGVYKPVVENFVIKPSIGDIERFVKEAMKHDLIAVDIETTGLRRDKAQIVCIGFAYDDENAICIPLLLKDFQNPWTNGSLERVRASINKLFEKDLVFQNAMFDVPILQRHGFELSWSNVKHDTVLLHHCLDQDTLINTLEWGKVPISALEGKKAFHVVSWNGEKLVPGRVKKCWLAKKTSDLVRVTFWNKDRKAEEGLWIDCTPDHEFPVQGLGKVEAQYLKPGMRLVRGQTSETRIGNKVIHRWCYEETKGPLNGLQVHHIDGNHKNNSPRNLLAVTPAEHASYHRDIQYKATRTMMRKEKERRNVKIDIREVDRLYYTAGLSYREVAEHLNCPDHVVVSILKHDLQGLRSRSEATRLRWQKAKNCRVLSVVPINIGERNVYDMEVEKTHYFSANGVIVSNCVSPESPHNLGFIVSMHGATPYWKEDFIKRNVSILDYPLEDLSTYNCRDCVVLHQVMPDLLAELDHMGPRSKWIYENISLKLLPIVSNMEDVGVNLSQSKLRNLKKKLEAELEEISSNIHASYNLPEGFNLSSADEVKYLLFSETPNSFRLLETLSDYEERLQVMITCNACKKRTWVDYPVVIHHCPNCSSEDFVVTSKEPKDRRKKKDSKNYQKIEYLQKLQKVERLYIPPRWKPRSTDKGASSIDDECRLSMRVALQNRLEDVKNLKTKRPEEESAIRKTLDFLVAFGEYQRVGKLLSTYTDYPTWDDGRVHGNILIHGTATARWSMTAPNLQNLPKKNKNLRKPFVPTSKDHIFLSGDYTNLEVWLLMAISEDEYLRELLYAGKNIHDENTYLFGVTKESADWNLARRAAKIFQFALIQYGGTERGIYEKVLLECPELTITFAEFKTIKKNYMKKYTGIASWQERVKAGALEERYVENCFGRRRRLLGAIHDVEKQALNTPIQSSAADVMNLALIRAWERMRASNLESKIVLQIHDQLVVDTFKPEFDEVLEILSEEMSRPVRINGRDIVLPVDFEVGPSLGELKELKK